MTIRLLDGSVLIRGGDIALHEDCCCTPPCWPDPCIIPSCNNWMKCWDTTCLECRTLQSIEISISGAGNATECAGGGDCCYGFDGCKCNAFNSTFIHDFTTSGYRSNWDLDTSNPPFTYDTCGTSQTLACGGLQINKAVTSVIAVVNKQVTYTSGLQYFFLPCIGGQHRGYICNNYTLSPGTYLVIYVDSETSNFGWILEKDTKIFIYQFENGVKNDPDCGDDQYYATCNYTGGTADLFCSYRITRVLGDFVEHSDCDSSPRNCDLSQLTVTVEAPVTTACTEEEGP